MMKTRYISIAIIDVITVPIAPSANLNMNTSKISPIKITGTNKNDANGRRG